MSRSTTSTGSRRTGRRAWMLAGAALVSSVAAVGLVPSAANATTINYTGTTSGTQSTITIHRGDTYQRVLNPSGSINAVLDDTNHTITSGTVTFQPSFTPTFVGPFNLNVYVRTDLEQVGSVTGTATPDATTSGITDLVSNATTRLRVTVYSQKGTVQDPTVDAKLSDPTKCWVDLPLTLKGTADRRAETVALKADPFTIPTFPNGTPDATHTCGFATNALNTQVAGANNAIDLHFTGGPITAHYTGVTTGTQSTIVIKKGDWFGFQQTVHPTGSIVADIDFSTYKTSNAVARFNPMDVPALPGVFSSLPANAHIVMTTIGSPVATLTKGTTLGIDNISVSTTARMAVTVTLANNPSLALTNGTTCFVDISLKLTGTVDRGTDALKLSSPAFTIPKFADNSCGLMTIGVNSLITGPHNTIDLNYHDGVVAP